MAKRLRLPSTGLLWPRFVAFREVETLCEYLQRFDVVMGAYMG